VNADTREPLDDKRRQAIAAAFEKGMNVALWAQLIPTAPAIVSPAGNRTFTELNARCNQLVRAFRAGGLVAGDSVALMCSNRTEFAEVFWATRRAGLRITPLNWHLTGEEAAYIVNDCDAKAFIAETRFRAAAENVGANAQRARVRLAIDGAMQGYTSYEAALRDQDTTDISDPQVGNSMLYTSGTTGKPKGVYRMITPPMPTNRSVTADYHPGESVHLCTGPLYHAAPLAFSLVVPHIYGASIVMMDGWDCEHGLELIERHRVTHSHMVPTMFHRLLSLPEATRKQRDVSSLEYILHGAAPCPVSIKKALIDWVGPIVHEYYGATEGAGTYVDSPTWLSKPGTVGKPEDPDHIRILDESGEALPRNQAGLVYLKAPPGPTRFSYYKDSAKTDVAYRGDHYTLGDVGYLDDDGYLFLTDRTAHLIISGGVNIYPAEAENVLLTHAAVADVGVIGVPNSEWGEEVKAVVMLQPGYAASERLGQELIEYCRAHLAHFKCPRSVDFVGELPRYDNGKLYKHKLREMYRRVV
jgi:long-chain acyl-CoA synthetase